jgi:hypothetical protein
MIATGRPASRWTATVAASSAAQYAGHLPGDGADAWLDLTDANLIWADPHPLNGWCSLAPVVASPVHSHSDRVGNRPRGWRLTGLARPPTVESSRMLSIPSPRGREVGHCRAPALERVHRRPDRSAA